MAVNNSVRTYIRPCAAIPETVQKRAVGPGEVVYTEGRESREDWISSLRPGDTAKIYSLSLVGALKSRRHPEPLKDFRAGMKELRKTGAVIVESSTGRTSEDQCQFDAMLFDAIEQIRTGQRGGPREGAGRPRTAFTDAELDIIEREWNSRKNPTRELAVKAIVAAGVKHARLTNVRRALKRMGNRPAKPLSAEERSQIAAKRKRAVKVYFIQDGETVKIGSSEDPKARLSGLATSTHGNCRSWLSWMVAGSASWRCTSSSPSTGSKVSGSTSRLRSPHT